jgi:hypothetical protein
MGDVPESVLVVEDGEQRRMVMVAPTKVFNCADEVEEGDDDGSNMSLSI